MKKILIIMFLAVSLEITGGESSAASYNQNSNTPSEEINFTPSYSEGSSLSNPSFSSEREPDSFSACLHIKIISSTSFFISSCFCSAVFLSKEQYLFSGLSIATGTSLVTTIWAVDKLHKYCKR